MTAYRFITLLTEIIRPDGPQITASRSAPEATVQHTLRLPLEDPDYRMTGREWLQHSERINAIVEAVRQLDRLHLIRGSAPQDESAEQFNSRLLANLLNTADDSALAHAIAEARKRR